METASRFVAHTERERETPTAYGAHKTLSQKVHRGSDGQVDSQDHCSETLPTYTQYRIPRGPHSATQNPWSVRHETSSTKSVL